MIWLPEDGDDAVFRFLPHVLPALPSGDSLDANERELLRHLRGSRGNENQTEDREQHPGSSYPKLVVI